MMMKSKKTYTNKIIWIIGASSGIGAALSQELASRGAILALSARRIQELVQLKNTLPGKDHEIFPLDVCDIEAVMKTAEIVHTKLNHIHSIIFLAAAYMPMKLDMLDMTMTRQIIEVNLLGAFHVVQAAMHWLKKQSYGQIALCGSVAGYYGLPGGQPYSATKAGIINLAESLRSELPAHIDVKLINPGFIKTPLTEKNNFKMPMIIEPPQAAVFISDGLLTKKFEIHFPKRFTFFVKLLQLLPYTLSLRISAKLNR